MVNKQVTNAIMNKLSPKAVSIQGEQLIIPNNSGRHDAGTVGRTPQNNLDIPNKKYVDDEVDRVDFTDYFNYTNDRMYLTNILIPRALDRTSDVKLTTTTVVNTTTETTIATGTIGANSLRAGNVIKAFGCGRISTHDANDSVTFRIKCGSTTLATFISTPKIVTDNAWHANMYCTIRSIGATGKLAYHIDFKVDDDGDSGAEDHDFTLDTTTAENLTITAEWDSADAGNSLSIDQFWIEFKN